MRQAAKRLADAIIFEVYQTINAKIKKLLFIYPDSSERSLEALT